MLRKSKLKSPRSNVKGIYLMTLVEGLYLQLLLLCVIQMVDMTTLPPVFNPTALNVTAYVGETATLPCSISHLGSREVIWKKVNEKHALTVGEFVFVKDPSFSVKHIPYRDEWNLMITNVQVKHAGKYECQVSTKENMHRYITLTVSDKRTRIRNEPSKNYPEVHISGPKYVERGHPIRLTCNATGSIRPPELIDWFQEGRKIKSNSIGGISISKYMRQETNTLYSELVIRHSDQVDSGTYICRSSDDKITSHDLLVLNGRSHEGPSDVLNESTLGKRESNIDPDNLPINEDPSKTGNHQSRNRPSHGLFFCVLLIPFVLI
ncbi:zwei Ig domain protein zig-8-like isoform X2 [Pecten maximus]|uniref:zwei Ig domain protein zig-8-like isoform X2 n=1 Tax=Pecten maximus TaxID=6579 RepID=UPI0014581A5D|nr:zwei Ig domain protein zig-8-like isoform X2 [Pecten maximus]